MLNQYDLYDISYALIIIRSNIDYKLNVKILSAIIETMECKEKYNDNQIRIAISSIKGLDKKRWGYVYHGNIYIYHRLLKDDYIYKTLIYFLDESIRLINASEFERAIDLVDAFHCLPNMIVDCDFHIPPSYWEIYVTPYREKWDKTFLIETQKQDAL